MAPHFLSNLTGRISGRNERDLRKKISNLEQTAIDLFARAKKAESLNEDYQKQIATLTDYLHDDLTGLPNASIYHNAARQAVTEYLKNGSYFAIVKYDLAGLSHFNTAYGDKTAGDPLISMEGRIISLHPLTRRDITSRIGGDDIRQVITGDREHVLKAVVEAYDNIRNRQSSINKRQQAGEKILPGKNEELFIGMGFSTIEDISSMYKPGDKISAELVESILTKMTDLAGDRTKWDKWEHGIYRKHPEYNREPQGIDHKNLYLPPHAHQIAELFQ
jgi:diguanylate cyclase (GGDEF)-like protein